MSHSIHQIAFYLHVIIGSIAMVVFWLPLLAKKGSRNHRLFGNLFVKGMYAVSISGLLMSTLVLIDPIAIRLPESIMDAERTNNFILQNRIFAGFLLMLSVLVFSNVRQSILVLEAKADRSCLKTHFHIALLVVLGLLGLTMGFIGLKFEILFERLVSL